MDPNSRLDKFFLNTLGIPSAPTAEIMRVIYRTLSSSTEGSEGVSIKYFRRYGTRHIALWYFNDQGRFRSSALLDCIRSRIESLDASHLETLDKIQVEHHASDWIVEDCDMMTRVIDSSEGYILFRVFNGQLHAGIDHGSALIVSQLDSRCLSPTNR